MGHRQVAQRLLVAAFTRTKHDEAAVLPDKKIPVRQHEIEALLLGETANHAKDRAGEFRIKAVAAQQLGTAHGLAGEVGRGEVCRQQCIRHGIPLGRINAVDQAREILGARLHHPVEAAAKLRRQDFLRIARADGRDAVGKKDAAFHHVHLPVELDAIDAHELLGQVGTVERAHREYALERNIVDGEHRL